MHLNVVHRRVDGSRPLLDPDWDEPAKNYGDIIEHVRHCRTLKDGAEVKHETEISVGARND